MSEIRVQQFAGFTRYQRGWAARVMQVDLDPSESRQWRTGWLACDRHLRTMGDDS